MPCYLFTYHAHGSWLPDHPRGFVKRGKGYLPSDPQLAEKYRGNMKESTVVLKSPEQRLVISAVLEAVKHINCQLHYVATDQTHIHALVSWSDNTA
ncbi:hypothetical protein [Adhaeretor mobilis]|uniref:Uncharacterized protein n=1 Tax=Adhaeretor mobilis TaxID=1930276 RepID=A0A517MUZ1_9BACT|nr:hypothetical protein [Adhaeretor mobilis]QDS98701.1 hypothetical protein HG15A2_19830 [Adhaeretor mobilis]